MQGTHWLDFKARCPEARSIERIQATIQHNYDKLPTAVISKNEMEWPTAQGQLQLQRCSTFHVIVYFWQMEL